MLANNDNMAIGAVEALKANGFFGDTGKFLPVVGVDATDAGARVMRAGELYGTVLNDAVNQAHGDVQPRLRARQWRHTDRREHGLPIDGQYVWVPYVPVSPEDLGRRVSHPAARDAHVPGAP